MKKAILALAILTTVVAPALGQSISGKTGVNSVLGISPKTEDFIKEAAMSDLTEIETSKLAQSRGNPEEKKFAEMMIADHTKTSTELKSMVPNNLKAALPTALDDAAQNKVARLRDAKEDSFSSEYTSMQISAHKDAVSLFERYADGGEDSKLKEWAGKTLPALKHHLEMAQTLDKNRK